MASMRLFLASLVLLFAVSTTCDAAKARPLRPNQYGSTAPNGGFYACDPKRYSDMGLNVSSFAFCDKSLPFNVRAKDLVDSMTVEEKIGQLGNTAPGVPRIGLPKYEWWSEALHGVSNVGPGTFFNATVPGATSFPTVILTTAAFNESLWKTIGQAVSNEARAMYNLGMAGLTFWSPNINPVRDPRWGRTLETPGEDPFTVGRYATNYVRGLQDVEGQENAADLNSRPLKVSACCKHYAAYDLDNWLGVDRFHFDARVTQQDMVETFQRPFEMCVKDGDASSIMCSYNRVDGFPACADARLMSETIRGDWNLHGYIVSDCDSIEVMHHGHKWLDDTPEDAVQQVLRAGLDLDCGKYYSQYGMSAMQQGKLRESDVDNALENLYVVLMRLGFFDGTPQYANLGKDDVCTQEHIELAAQAAREGIVLLKNNNNLLPLDVNKYKKLAIVGPHANATKAMIGNYAGIPCKYVSPLDAFSSITQVDYEMGCDGVACKNETFIFPAVRASKTSDATIIFVGIDLSIEAEGLDRTDLVLPGYQTQLITEIANTASKPIVLVLLSAGAIDISFAQNHPKIDSIIWAGYPGEQGGNAIADVIFGKYNPGGRLPITWYKSDYVDKLPMTSMQLRPNVENGYPGRTYKFYDGPLQYPFGFGLSYTEFSYSFGSTTRTFVTKLDPLQHCYALAVKNESYIAPCPSVQVQDVPTNRTIDFEVNVMNTGGKDGDHVVMVYLIPPSYYVGLPRKQLVGFQRVFVPAGQTVTVKFSLNALKSLSVVSDTANVVLPEGEHTIVIGDGKAAVSFPVQVIFQ